MTYGGRLLACAAFSLGVHLMVARGASFLPRAADARPERVKVRVIEAPPPAPEPTPEPTPQEPPAPIALPEPVLASKPRVPRRPVDTLQPVQPPTEPLPPGGVAGAKPRFGITMESTSQAGGGPATPTGSTGGVKTPAAPAKPTGGGEGTGEGPAAPAEAYEVSVMPLPRGRCTGRYTEQARQAAVEGTVVLDLVVGADGRPRNIKIVRRLGHGLDEAAVAALTACRFTPGERAGVAVPVRVREFKIRFLLDEN